MKNRFLPFALALTFCWHYSQAQWTSLGSGITPTPRTIFSLSAVNENVIWGIAMHPSYLGFPIQEFTKTIDGGQSWLPGNFNTGDAYSALYIHALDENTAWVVMTNNPQQNLAKILKTVDGGVTWTQQPTGFPNTNEAAVGIYFWNELEGMAIGSPGTGQLSDVVSAYFTDDGGNNWQKVVSPEWPALVAGEGIWVYGGKGVFAVYEDHVWMGTRKNRVLHSTDRGKTWTISPTGQTSPDGISSVAFRDAQNGLAITGSPLKVARTVDGGASWELLTTSFTSNQYGYQVEHIPGTRSTYYIVLNASQAAISYNDGLKWEIIPVNADSWCIDFLSPTIGFAGSYTTNPTKASIYEWSGPALGNRLFVNDDATGANDGTSWANAYTDLQDALAISEVGDQIWVAEGTYKPDTIGGVQTSTFLIDKNLQLYGGFAGTESTLAQRGNPKEHPTILSGDLMGNDLENNPTANKLDNVLTVVRVNANITNETVIDGFIIRNGYADGSGNLSNGGGMFCSGQPIIRHCIFERNGAFSQGGGVRLNSIASPGIVFENCDFKNNQANIGGGLNIMASYFTFKACSFSGNKAVTGALQDNGGGVFATNSYGVVQNCSFTGNSALEFGGGFHAWTSQGFNGGSIEVRGCHFENNTAANFGGLTFSPWGNNSNFTVSNCDFINNTSTYQGAGLGNQSNSVSNNISFKVDSCYFSGNTSSGSSGVFISMNGKNTNFELTNSVFEGNQTTMWYATAAVYSGNNSTGSALLDNCIFQNNNSVNSAGLDLGGGGDFDYTVTNCDFLQNHANNVNAGFDIWGDVGSSLNFAIEKCLIDGNTAGTRSAGFWVIPASDDFHATMKDCRILNNQSPKGAAIDVFREAVSGYPALNNASITFENCLIANNSGTSGVISIDTLRHVNFLNCTVADNTGGALQNGNLGGVTLQNTILHNPSFPEYTAANEASTFTSHGGNLIGDNSLAGLLIPTDKEGLDPLFVGNGDYHLLEGSPCVDAGKDDGVTAAFDLDGAPRIQSWRVDMGAYESPFVSSTREQLTGKVTLSPNPTTDFLNLHLPEPTTTPLQVSLFDPQGRLLQSQVLSNGKMVNVQGLAAGIYSVKVTDGERNYVGKFVKQ